MSSSRQHPSRGAPPADLSGALRRIIELQRAGRGRDAEIQCRQLLKRVPEHADVLQLMGIISQQQGKPEQALECYTQALAKAPDDPAANVNVANLHNQLGRLELAIAHYRTALASWPRDAELLNNLGFALHKQGDSHAALEHYERALAVDPQLPRTLKNAGDALLALGEAAAARERYRAAIAQAAEYGEAWAGLGNACFALGSWREALEAYATAEDHGVVSATLANAIGNARLELGHVRGAIAAYERVLALAPRHAGALVNLARCHEQRNRLDQALECIERALELEPGDTRARGLHAAVLRRRGEPRRALQVLQEIDTDAADDETAGAVHFELGRVHDKLGDYAAAYRQFTLANERDSRTPAWRRASATRYLSLIAQLQHILMADADTAATDAQGDDQGDDQAPVFVVGFPRSGTTLTERILDSHPGTCVLDERPVLHAVRERLGERYPAGVASLDAQELAGLRAEYFATAATFGYIPDLLLVDKTPLHLIHVPLIRRLFPRARFILVLRHPCDACLSCFMQPFKANDAMANFLTLAGTVELYTRVFDLWAGYAGVYTLNAHTLRYEDLVVDFRSETEKLLRFLDLEWHDNVLAYHRHAAEQEWISTPSYHQVTQPIYASAVARWRHYWPFCGEPMERLAPYALQHGYGALNLTA